MRAFDARRRLLPLLALGLGGCLADGLPAGTPDAADAMAVDAAPADAAVDATPGDGGEGDAGASDAANGPDATPEDATALDATPADAMGDDAGAGDATVLDATPVDAGAVDAGGLDAAAVDALSGDATPLDAGGPDAAPMDALSGDATPLDAGGPDATPVDAEAPDAEAPDAEWPDAEAPDAAPLDAGGADATALDASATDAGLPPTACPHGGPVAFPGAQGFGACATGGRGGRVIAVTHLGASGPGSLQAALDESGPRTVVFRVSGVIAGTPILQRGDVTIAGESSPGGVTLRGLAIESDEVCDSDGCPLPQVAPQNVILRYVRLRPAGQGDDGLRLHRAKRVIVDHVSIGNAIDEAVQISQTSDLSLQNSLLAETLVTGHDVEYGGMLLNYSDPARGFPLTRLSIHHNVWNRIAGRVPELSRENFRSDELATTELEVSSNLFWDVRHPMPVAQESGPWSDGRPVYWRMNYVDNYFRVRGTYPYGMVTFYGDVPPGSPSSFYFAGNRLSRFPALSDWQLWYCCNDFPDAVLTQSMPFFATTPPYAAPARHPFPAIAYDVVGEAAMRAHALADVGCLPRDAMDERLMSFVVADTFDPAPLDQNPAGDALLVDPSPPAPPADADGDGMPDEFEVTHGLDPADPADRSDTQLSLGATGVPGYTNLEVSLFSRAAERRGP